MSLKAFHVVFIALSLVLMLFVGVWTMIQRHSGGDWRGTGAAALVGFAVGLAYLAWFKKEYRKL